MITAVMEDMDNDNVKVGKAEDDLEVGGGLKEPKRFFAEEEKHLCWFIRGPYAEFSVGLVAEKLFIVADAAETAK